MLIKRSRILNLDLYLGRLTADRFHVVHELDEVPETRLAAIDFAGTPIDGDTILPAVLGPVSRFNAEGRWIVHRNQPKEPRYIRTTFWQWQTWDGEQHEDFKDIYRDCYPRELLKPPSVQLTYRVLPGRRLLVSPLLVNQAESRDHNKHVINLFLELFGSCVLAGEDLAIPPTIRTRQVNWRFLPPGRYPWDNLKDHLNKMLRATASGTHLVIMDRQETITRYAPDELYVGKGGFADYIAYVFKSRGLVIMESIRRDNALYAFGEAWEQCSKLTKAEVINNRLHRERIIHTAGWKARLQRVLECVEAAE